MISEHGAALCGVHPPWAAGSRQRAERTRFSPLFRRERNNDRNARFACGRAFCSVCWHKQKRKGGRFLFLIGERFLFLKKRNKRHCGGGFLSEKRMFPAHPTQLYRKTDGFHMNRPFCVACWRKQRERRETIVPQMIFFCVVGLHGKADAQARRTRAETRRRREAYPLWYSDRRQRRMCLRPSV